MTYTAIGHYDKEKAGHAEPYFVERHTFIDYRGLLKISPLSYWGFGNMVITAKHNIMQGEFEAPMIPVNVTVEDYAWITSGCILYNCRIQHHAVVSIGAVVSGLDVEPYTVVAGNPAVVVAEWDGKRWISTRTQNNE